MYHPTPATTSNAMPTISQYVAKALERSCSLALMSIAATKIALSALPATRMGAAT